MAAQRRKNERRRAWRWRMPLLVGVVGLVMLLASVATPLGGDSDPLLSGMQPAPGSVVDAGPVMIEARVAVSSSSAVDTVELRVDGRPHENQSVGEGGTRTIRATVELRPGPHTAQVLAWDDEGRSTQAWWRFEVASTGGRTAAEDEADREEPAGLSVGAPTAGLDLEPAPGSVVTELSRLVVGIDEAVNVNASSGTLTVNGQEVPLTLDAEGNRLIAEVGNLPSDLPQGRLPARLVAEVGVAAGQLVDVDYEFSWERLPVSRTEEGFLLAQAVSAAVGEGTLSTYTLEVEPGIGVDPHTFADQVERILSDPRSWTGQGQFALQRVETSEATIRVVLASPPTVDRFCAEAGLDTEGRYSCWNGRFAMLNVERWLGAVEAFEGDIPTYRAYLVNHEFGHGLGFGHVDCPIPGEPAPVMQQQSIDLEGCLPNGWPFPREP